jgi:DNA polymerase III epsilon subunit-like protein
MALNSLQHWNGCQMCVIDTETTGLDPQFHELVQICILPLDSNMNVRTDVIPFYINLKPDHPERFDPGAGIVNKMDLASIIKTGMDREKAKDLLEEWVVKLGLPLNARGYNRCKIIPAGHNYIQFDLPFILRWLTKPVYDEIFHYHPRDTMVIAAYLNDRAAYHAERVPFSKISLDWVCNQYGIENRKAHDAMSDCIATAAALKKLLERGLIG